jgi:hypothetical protein
MENYSQPPPGKNLGHGNGIGAPSPEQVERRAREIAMIDERNPDEFTEADWSQARHELMGEENNVPPRKLQITPRWPRNGASSPVPKATAYRVPAQRKRKASVSISWSKASRKQLTTKCSKRAGKNATKREKILEPALRWNRLHNGGGGIDLFSPRANPGSNACAIAFIKSEISRCAVCWSRTRRLRRAIDAGRQSDQMAPRPYHVVFRKLLSWKNSSRDIARKFQSTLTFSIPIITLRATCIGGICAG